MNRNNFLHSPWMFYLIGIVTISLLVTSCGAGSHQKYPASWGTLIPVQEHKCADISGIYWNLGQNERGIVDYNLSKILGFRDKIGERYVHIKQLKDNTFEISGWDLEGDEERLVYKRSYGQPNYICTSEGIRTSSYTESFFLTEGLGEFGVGSGTFYLTKNTDGDLVVKDTATVTGCVWIIPCIGGWTRWYRFTHEVPKEE